MESFLTDMETGMMNLGGIKFIDLIEPQEDQEEKFAMYFKEGNEYIPSTKLKIVKKIASGAYKAQYKREEWHFIPVPINTDEIYSFDNDMTSKLLEETQLFWDKTDLYKQNNITHKRGILLTGAPGTGKTAIINMLIAQIIKNNGLIFIANNAQEFAYLAEVLSSVVREIEPERPIITIIEDIDQVVASLGGDSQILDFLDGKTAINHHLTILTSNNTTDLSSALLRPSRIDMCVEILAPTAEVRYEYFKRKGIHEEHLEEYTKKTEEFSFAELKEVFIGTYILGKDIDKVIEQITNPYECKDYLNDSNKIKGID